MIVVNHDALVGPWVEQITGAHYNPARASTIGWIKDRKLIAAVMYDAFNGTSVNMHVASNGSRTWLAREFLWYAFYYPFVELGVKRVTGMVPASNLDARRFDEHLGFVLEAALKDALPDGDLLIYRMFKEDCRWLNVRSSAHGQLEQRVKQAVNA